MVHAKRVSIVKVQMIKERNMLYEGRKITSPDDVQRLVEPFFHQSDREHFLVVCLDTKNQPMTVNICHVGSLNASIVHPREVFKTAILSNAASIIVAHNHPSGDTTPSKEDNQVTERLKEAGKIIGIELLDHLIIGDDSFLSLKETGIL